MSQKIGSMYVSVEHNALFNTSITHHYPIKALLDNADQEKGLQMAPNGFWLFEMQMVEEELENVFK